jgi:protein-tyrosine phosphatase
MPTGKPCCTLQYFRPKLPTTDRLLHCEAPPFESESRQLMNFIKRNGGRRPYLLQLVESSKAMLGRYTNLSTIDWRSANRLVFVCKGNICRSPYAEFRARELGIQAVSFGFDARDGAEANASASRNARARGVDLSGHVARKLRPEEIGSGDVVLLFEPVHVDLFQSNRHAPAVALSLLGLWSQPRRPLVWDPYGNCDEYFQTCFSIIDSGLCSIKRMRDGAKSDPVAYPGGKG